MLCRVFFLSFFCLFSFSKTFSTENTASTIARTYNRLLHIGISHSTLTTNYNCPYNIIPGRRSLSDPILLPPPSVVCSTVVCVTKSHRKAQSEKPLTTNNTHSHTHSSPPSLQHKDSLQIYQFLHRIYFSVIIIVVVIGPSHNFHPSISQLTSALS